MLHQSKSVASTGVLCLKILHSLNHFGNCLSLYLQISQTGLIGPCKVRQYNSRNCLHKVTHETTGVDAWVDLAEADVHLEKEVHA